MDQLPVSLLCRPRMLDKWKAGWQLSAPAAFTESQLTEISSVIKWRQWSMICLVGMLVTHRAHVRKNISSHRLIKAANNQIESHTEVITSSNKEVILRIQTLIKLPDTFIKLSQCKGWTPCTAAVRGVSFLKAPAWTSSETCHLFRMDSAATTAPTPFQAGFTIDFRDMKYEHGRKTKWGGVVVNRVVNTSPQSQSPCWPCLRVVLNSMKVGCSTKKQYCVSVKFPVKLKEVRRKSHPENQENKVFRKPKTTIQFGLEMFASRNSSFWLGTKTFSMQPKNLKVFSKSRCHCLDSNAPNCSSFLFQDTVSVEQGYFCCNQVKIFSQDWWV